MYRNQCIRKNGRAELADRGRNSSFLSLKVPLGMCMTLLEHAMNKKTKTKKGISWSIKLDNFCLEVSICI